MEKLLVNTYHIRPNYHTQHSGFSQLLGKLVAEYVSTYTKGTLKKRSAKDLPNDFYAMFLCFFFFILIFFINHMLWVLI